MEKKKKVIIIGAGLAGMSAGYYLQINGFDTEIFEMHSSSGGLCTSWKRKEYLIDGCIHFMGGTSPEDPTYRFWNDIIDMKSLEIVCQDTHCVVEDEKRNRIHFYSDVNLLEKELLRKAPEDKKPISELIYGIKKFGKMKVPTFKPYENMSVWDKLKVAYQMMPYLLRMYKYVRLTNKDFASKFKNIELRHAFEVAFLGYSTLFYTIMTLVWRHKKAMGYPKGGAVRIAGLMEKSYQQVGGIVHFDSKVAKIIVENNDAKGVELVNGEKYFADIIISAADGHATIFEMLDGKFIDKNIIERYGGKDFETIDKTLYVSLGIDKDFSCEPHKLYFSLEKPIKMDPMTDIHELEFTHYCEDSAAAPKGKSLLTLMPESKDWAYWYRLRLKDRAGYDMAKARIANEIIDALDRRFGGIKEKVEMIDVATPATYIRYTNNWTGGQISWKATAKTFGKPTLWQINGLKNLYMTGQWAGITGGLNNVVMMGNHLTQIICKNEGIKFKNTI